MAFFLKLIVAAFKKASRNFYWLYNVSKIKGLKQSKISFPFNVEGKGTINVGSKAIINKDASLKCADRCEIHIKDQLELQEEVVISVSNNSNVTIGNNFSLLRGAHCYIHANWQFGDNIYIGAYSQVFSREKGLHGALKIGNGSHIGDFGLVDVSDNITIGSGVAIGPRCTIYTHDHEYRMNREVPWHGIPKTKPVIINDGAWVGSNVTILPGVVIGNGAVVAAGSVLAKNVEPYTLVGGVPAKMIKQL